MTGMTLVAVVVFVVVGLAVGAVAIGGSQLLDDEGYLGPHPPTPDGPAPEP